MLSFGGGELELEVALPLSHPGVDVDDILPGGDGPGSGQFGLDLGVGDVDGPCDGEDVDSYVIWLGHCENGSDDGDEDQGEDEHHDVEEMFGVGSLSLEWLVPLSDDVKKPVKY